MEEDAMPERSNHDRVDLVEVAPRDGFQSIEAPIPTQDKIEIVEGLLNAGFHRMEVGSVVSPKAVPQMADIAELFKAVEGRGKAGLSLLVPNAKGAEIALNIGCEALVFVVSVSETHNRRNVRRSVDQSLQELADIMSVIGADNAVSLRIDLATAFDCPFDGDVPVDAVRRVHQEARRLAPKAEVALCDTTGRADPYRVGDRFGVMIAEDPDTVWAFHGHDTFGMGVANAYAAYLSGVRVFDAAAAGLGGCPFAPGASGNTAMEDLVYAFARAGVATGIDLPRLLDAADRVAVLPGGQAASHLRVVPRDRIPLTS